ncbi:MAG: type II toxin-antitoxin system Phd/YefM family antitoxin [Nitrospinae bacterium]|nr:type II toxin-antitoxin system Phd/YefM family antitoxin [Nitrospinota bacterium]
MKLHPEVLTKNGKKEFVVLPYEEFVALQELLADAEDIRDLRVSKKKEANRPSVGLKEVKKKFSNRDS